MADFPKSPTLLLSVVLAASLSGCAAHGRPPALLGSAPATTAMVYPVGDPLDYQRAAPGETRGFAVTRGIEGGRRHARHEGVDLSNRAKGGQVRAVAPGVVVATRRGHDG